MGSVQDMRDGRAHVKDHDEFLDVCRAEGSGLVCRHRRGRDIREDVIRASCDSSMMEPHNTQVALPATLKTHGDIAESEDVGRQASFWLENCWRRCKKAANFFELSDWRLKELMTTKIDGKAEAFNFDDQ